MDTLKKVVEIHLILKWGIIGIDRPANHDEIVDFIVNDVEETADANYSSEDLNIAFRRYLEKDLEL